MKYQSGLIPVQFHKVALALIVLGVFGLVVWNFIFFIEFTIASYEWLCVSLFLFIIGLYIHTLVPPNKHH